MRPDRPRPYHARGCAIPRQNERAEPIGESSPPSSSWPSPRRWPARLRRARPSSLLTEGQRRELLPVVRGDAELLALDQVVAGLAISVTSDAAGGAVTLSHQKHEVSLYNRKSLAAVDGDLRLLSSPVILEDGRWLVPVDAVPRLLGPLLGRRAEWRAASRVLIVGNVPVPRVNVSTFLSGDVARVVFEASEKVPFRVEQETGRVTVAVARDLVDVTFQQQRLTGGIVESVQFVGGRGERLRGDSGPALQGDESGRAGLAPAPRAGFRGPSRVGGRARRDAECRRAFADLASTGLGRRPAHGRDRPRTRRGGDRGQGSGRHPGEGRRPPDRAPGEGAAREQPGPPGLHDARTGRVRRPRHANGRGQQLQGRRLHLHPRERQPCPVRGRHRGLLPVLPGERRGEPTAGPVGGRPSRGGCGRHRDAGPGPHPVGHGPGRAPRGVLGPGLADPGGAGRGAWRRRARREAGPVPRAGGRRDARDPRSRSRSSATPRKRSCCSPTPSRPRWRTQFCGASPATGRSAFRGAQVRLRFPPDPGRDPAHREPRDRARSPRPPRGLDLDRTALGARHAPAGGRTRPRKTRPSPPRARPRRRLRKRRGSGRSR